MIGFVSDIAFCVMHAIEVSGDLAVPNSFYTRESAPRQSLAFKYRLINNVINKSAFLSERTGGVVLT